MRACRRACVRAFLSLDPSICLRRSARRRAMHSRGGHLPISAISRIRLASVDRRTASVPRTAARWLILGGHKGSSSVSLVFRFPGGANRVLCTSGRGGARGTPGISSLISSTSLFFKVQSVRLRSGSLCDESICRRIKTFRDFGCCWLTSPTLKVITPLFLNTRHGCLIIVI